MTDDAWYWCLDHKQAEPTHSPCPPDHRLGPYPTKEAAEHWKEQFDRRNDEWDRDEEEDG
jgi:hypothetical protein